MIKCEVIKDCAISIKAGSIVLVNERQYELARAVLKPIIEKKEEPKSAEPKTKKKK